MLNFCPSRGRWPAALVVIFALGAASLHAAETSSAPSIPHLLFKERTLKNGLQVITLEDHSTPTVAINVWYRVGSKNDPVGRSGFAHLFEHLMFKSTKDMPTETIDRLTEDVGGYNNANTADDRTMFYEVIPSNHLQRLLWAEADRMSSLNVSEANFQSERKVVEEEYRQRILAQPFGQFWPFIVKNSWLVHSYKRPPIGSIHDLEAASLEDVREFHATYYRPDDATLIVVGDFDPKQLDAWVDQYFGPIPQPKSEMPKVMGVEPPREDRTKVTEYSPQVPLPVVCLNYLVPGMKSEDSIPLQVAAQILGGGESSRLYQSLVYQKQIAQSAECDADLRTDSGLLCNIIVGASGREPGMLESAALAVEKNFLTNPISDEELQKAKNQLLYQALQDRQTNEGKAEALGDAVIYEGDPQRANTDLDALQKVTAKQVRDTFAKYVTPKNRLLLEFLPAAMKPAAK
jgi:zinc protease